VWLPELASLCLEEALAQVLWKVDDGDSDAVVLKRPGRPGPRAGQERGCSQRVAEAQDELRPRVAGGGYPGQLEGVCEYLVALRALRRSLMGPALGQDCLARVGAVDFDALPDGTVIVAGFSSQPSRAPRRSSITRSAARCSPESPAGAVRAPGAAPASAGAPVPGAAPAGAGVLPRCCSWFPSHSLTTLPSGPGRRRTIPARSSARQTWFTVCRGEMPVRAAIWSSSRGRELTRIAAMTRSR
jgi:hypothetical protein